LWQARSDLEKMRTLATNWEVEVASVRGENRGLRSSLEGAQVQQRQAEERGRALEQRAKEADDLKAALNAKAAALAASEDQLLRERTARQGAEGRLQQGQAALADARSALEQERVAREAAQKSLEERNAKLSKVEGELMVLSINNASQELALQEQGETVKGLELQELRGAALETCRAVEEGEAQAGSSLASRLRALGGHVTERMRGVLHLGVQKALGVVRSHYEVNFEALAEGCVVPDGVEDEVAMERVDALAADAVVTLAEAFEELLFPDAADAAAPPA
jgi:chromosome segregation ATPase